MLFVRFRHISAPVGIPRSRLAAFYRSISNESWTNFITSPMTFPSTGPARRIPLRLLDVLPSFLDLQFRFWSKAMHNLFHMHTVLTCLFASEEGGRLCVDALRNVLACVLIAERAHTMSCSMRSTTFTELSIRTTRVTPVRCIVRHVIFAVINVVLILPTNVFCLFISM